MVLQKPLDHVLVDTMDIKLTLAHPACKVGNTTAVGIDGVGRIASLGQVMRERINVGR